MYSAQIDIGREDYAHAKELLDAGVRDGIVSHSVLPLATLALLQGLPALVGAMEKLESLEVTGRFETFRDRLRLRWGTVDTRILNFNHLEVSKKRLSRSTEKHHTRRIPLTSWKVLLRVPVATLNIVGWKRYEGMCSEVYKMVGAKIQPDGTYLWGGARLALEEILERYPNSFRMPAMRFIQSRVLGALLKGQARANPESLADFRLIRTHASQLRGENSKDWVKILGALSQAFPDKTKELLQENPEYIFGVSGCDNKIRGLGILVALGIINTRDLLDDYVSELGISSRDPYLAIQVVMGSIRANTLHVFGDFISGTQSTERNIKKYAEWVAQNYTGVRLANILDMGILASPNFMIYVYESAPLSTFREVLLPMFSGALRGNLVCVILNREPQFYQALVEDRYGGDLKGPLAEISGEDFEKLVPYALRKSPKDLSGMGWWARKLSGDPEVWAWIREHAPHLRALFVYAACSTPVWKKVVSEKWVTQWIQGYDPKIKREFDTQFPWSWLVEPCLKNRQHRALDVLVREWVPELQYLWKMAQRGYGEGIRVYLEKGGVWDHVLGNTALRSRNMGIFGHLLHKGAGSMRFVCELPHLLNHAIQDQNLEAVRLMAPMMGIFCFEDLRWLRVMDAEGKIPCQAIRECLRVLGLLERQRPQDSAPRMEMRGFRIDLRSAPKLTMTSEEIQEQ